MANVMPPEVKKGLAKQCKKAAKKISKVAPGEKNENKLEKLIKDEICKEVQNLDKKDLENCRRATEEVGRKEQLQSACGDDP